MVDKQTLFSMIDALPESDLEELYQYIRQRRQVPQSATGTHPAVAEPAHHTSADAIRDEVNTLIDDKISQVRRKRETQEVLKQGS